MEAKKLKPLGQTVKETIDFVFELLAPHQDGVTMKTTDFGFYGQMVVKILASRRIIERKKCSNNSYKYKWVANHNPTPVLYGSITDEIRDITTRRSKAQEARKKEKRAALRKEPAPVAQPSVVTVREYVTDLDGFSAQELWDELKKRGYSIDNGGLYVTKKAYLD